MRAHPNAIQHAAREAVLDVLLAATEAAVWLLVEAHPERVLDSPRLTVEPARDPDEAAHRIVNLADHLVAAVRRYRVLCDLGIHGTDPRPEPLPF